MTTKVKTAIFGKDLRITLKDYPLSKNGNKIDIVSGGEGYFMPEIGPTNFLDWPKRKRFLFFGPWVYQRIFFSVKKGERCLDFAKQIAYYDEETKNAVVLYGPDEEAVKEAVANLLATRIGKDTETKTPWYIWAILVISLSCLGLLVQVAGVFR